jgi:argininosuccinate lyase
LIEEFKETLKNFIKENQNIEIPGYTHMQKAMPTTIEKWLLSFKESMQDNEEILNASLKIIDKSPLGSAAGFGVPVFEIDKKMTAKKMGFSKVPESDMSAQLSRGKNEGNILNTLSNIMLDLNKLATDLIMFNMQEFGFIELSKKHCSGSSIMPQKKNPDVLELVRAKYHEVLGEEFKVKSMSSNLISGYNRDMQLTKEPIMKGFEITKNTLKIMSLVIKEMKINKDNCKKAMTKELYTTKKAYELVKEGMSFRDAYNKIKEELKD